MEFVPHLSQDSAVPLYRQLYEQIAQRIRSGDLGPGERLPATRELAGLLGLNRTTVSAAYELLESAGLIAGQVGRGSFVSREAQPAAGVNWASMLERSDAVAAHSGSLGPGGISFVMSRPARALFPLDEFRASCTAVLERPDLGDILQLGSPRRLRTAAAILAPRGARAWTCRPGRRSIDHQRLPAGARPDRPRAAAAGRFGRARRSSLYGLEKSAHRDGRGAAGNSGGCGRHGRRPPDPPAGARASPVSGGDAEFPKSYRRHSAPGGAPQSSRSCARCGRPGG